MFTQLTHMLLQDFGATPFFINIYMLTFVLTHSDLSEETNINNDRSDQANRLTDKCLHQVKYIFYILPSLD